MEHLNRECKSYVQALGANLTNAVTVRAGRCIGSIVQVTDNFDTIAGIIPGSGSNESHKFSVTSQENAIQAFKDSRPHPLQSTENKLLNG